MLKSILKRWFHKCRDHIEETGVWISDGWIPVSGIPTPCGGSESGVMWSGHSEDKEGKCSICGRSFFMEGKPAVVKVTLIKGHVVDPAPVKATPAWERID